MKPTDEQINAEIAALSDLQGRVRRYTAFGDDNRAAIIAQIGVLRNRRTVDDVYRDFHLSDYEQSSALSAADWLSGDLAADELSPADSWRGLEQ
jgi:hypothetical protein